MVAGETKGMGDAGQANDPSHPTGMSGGVKRKHRGAAKRSAQKRVGKPVSMQPIDLATPAKSAAAQEANARSAVAAGRKERADAETNTEAFPAIKRLCVKYSVGLDARGLPTVVMHGAELICERLVVLVEVEALSAASSTFTSPLDDAAFVGKRRDSILRVAPGPSNAALRAKFGLSEPVRADKPATLKKAAQRLLAGKKAEPRSRAAKLLTAEDEKRLRAMIKSISTSAVELKSARAESVSRTCERDLLNTALELFYDDFAASIGLVLEGDELARLQALELIPRRAERRAAQEKGGAGGPAGAGGATGAAGASSPGGAQVPATVSVAPGISATV